MRLGSGKLNWGEIVYEISYHQLLKADYLSPITNKVTGTPNLDNIQINMGEYSIEQLEAVMSDAGLLLSAVEAIKKHTVNRNSVLIFTVSIKHSNLLKEILAKNDIDAEMICGDTPTETRDRILSDFKNNKIKYLINTEILLEGFDATCIDCIVCLRPTKSFVLHTQMLGRGVRKHEGKDNCLLVDMSGNLQELGALGSPYTEPSKKEAKRSHGKICPSCEEFVPPTTRECPDCAFQFPEPEVSLIKHNADPDFESDVIYNPITEYDVSGVRYCEHTNKKNGNKSIRIDYIVQSQYGKISEWIAPFSESDWARNNCFNFFKKRGHELASPTNTYTMEALLWHCEQMKKPIKIEVIKEGKYDRVSNHYFEEEAKPQITSQELADELGEGDLGDLW